jgi:hypothetical protein
MSSERLNLSPNKNLVEAVKGGGELDLRIAGCWSDWAR